MDKQERICCSTQFSSCTSALPPAASSLFLPVSAILILFPWEPCGLCLCIDGGLPLCPLDGWLNFAYLLLLFHPPILSCSYFHCIFEIHLSVFLWNYFFVCAWGVCVHVRVCDCVPRTPFRSQFSLFALFETGSYSWSPLLSPYIAFQV